MNIFNKYKICHLTHTHSEYKDIWPIYFGQMNKFWDLNIKHFFLNNSSEEIIPENYDFIVYEDKLPYTERLIKTFSELNDFDFVIFDHEDMFLYSQPDFNEIASYMEYMISDEFDHIRLIRGGDCIFEKVNGSKSLFKIDSKSKWIFSVQPGFWKISKLIDLLKLNRNLNIWDLERYSQKKIKRLKLNCAFSHENGKKRGIHHFDNQVYPYIASAIIKGKWNLSEYPLELGNILDQYKIDPLLRGTC